VGLVWFGKDTDKGYRKGLGKDIDIGIATGTGTGIGIGIVKDNKGKR
jgi:hypothetical protein